MLRQRYEEDLGVNSHQHRRYQPPQSWEPLPPSRDLTTTSRGQPTISSGPSTSGCRRGRRQSLGAAGDH
uniref:Uncharacterized protein n=1 Tax=Arundo donax TaxID=35708 RepID=A0A0A8ZRA2_ARUDO